jgi:hypothetical protein
VAELGDMGDLIRHAISKLIEAERLLSEAHALEMDRERDAQVRRAGGEAPAIRIGEGEPVTSYRVGKLGGGQQAWSAWDLLGALEDPNETRSAVEIIREQRDRT